MVALWTAHAQLDRFHVIVANQALHEDTKVRGPEVEASYFLPVAHYDLFIELLVIMIVYKFNFFLSTYLQKKNC